MTHARWIVRRSACRTVRGTAALLLLVLVGCGPRDNPPSSRTGNAGGLSDSLAAAAAQDTAPAAPASAVDSAPASDPRAAALAQRLIAALGGESAWQSARCWYFTYAMADNRAERLRRTHYWERATGRHRLEGIDGRQRPFVIIHTLGDSTGGIVLRGGEQVTNPMEQRALCRAADSLWVNDSTWLLLPFKLRDPGAQLGYAGTESHEEKSWDVIEVGFEARPLVPRGRYRLYIDRTTGMLDRTALVPEPAKPAKSAKGKKSAKVATPVPMVYEWLGWRLFGGVLVADERRAQGSGPAILFPQLAVLDVFPADTFAAPAPVVLPAL